MPHQCVRCSKLHEDGSDAILKGCSCGGKLFFFIKKERLVQLQQEMSADLSPDESKQIEEDVYSMLGYDEEKPVVLDLESVRVLKPGKYEVDIVNLFKGEPLIFKLKDGKYVIDVPETFRRLSKSQ